MKKVSRRYYNVCAYLGNERVMKETLTARNRAEALDFGRLILKQRGFKPSDVNLIAIPISRRRIDRLLASM